MSKKNLEENMEKNVSVQDIPDLVRVENVSVDTMQEKCMELTHAVYPHDKILR